MKIQQSWTSILTLFILILHISKYHNYYIYNCSQLPRFYGVKKHCFMFAQLCLHGEGMEKSPSFVVHHFLLIRFFVEVQSIFFEIIA